MAKKASCLLRRCGVSLLWTWRVLALGLVKQLPVEAEKAEVQVHAAVEDFRRVLSLTSWCLA